MRGTTRAWTVLVRVFIFFHDCCHGSFFPSRVANAVTAYLTGLLAFTPYEAWQHPHHRHHTVGALIRFLEAPGDADPGR